MVAVYCLFWSIVIGGGLGHCIELPPFVVGVVGVLGVAGAGGGLLQEGNISAARIIDKTDSLKMLFMVPPKVRNIIHENYTEEN
jgi:hypothetical protein